MTALKTTAAASPDRWLYCFRPAPKAGLRMFCFPYAGGNAMVFRDWAAKLPPGVEVSAVQLPGRGNRMQEPPMTRLAELVEAMAPALLPHLDQPFVFFGHSMGATLSFELARWLRRERGPSPLKLFVSGRSAPQLNKTHPPIHDLPQPELVEELKRLNGTPHEVLEHPELMELMLPLLRADFCVCDTYEYTEAPPLDCPITVFGGLEDTGIPRRNLEAWREQTTAAFTLRMLPGDHFFLHSKTSLLLQLLSAELQQLAAGREK
jgi:medium-chain acyl-[acyl-carrier-protein] hydrolase